MKLSVVGTGYVGLVTGAALADMGNSVTCIDSDREKIAALRAGDIPFYEPGLKELVRKNIGVGRLSFTTDLASGVRGLSRRGSKIIFIAVGTPLKLTGGADLSQVISVTEDLVKVLDDYKIICIKSTVPVGTSELMLDIFASAGKHEGENFDIVFNPEFLREGDALHDFFHPTRIVIGTSSQKAGQQVTEVFKSLGAPVIFTTIANAKMIKYAANAFLASRVSFINEIANICESVGADVQEVAKGLGYDKRLGNGYLSPGIGFGGPCLTKDLRALIKMAQDHGYEPYYLKSILEKNEHQVREVVRKIREALGDTLYNKKIGILGLAFKARTSDVRTSLAIRVIELLQDQGATVKAYDPLAMPEARRILSGVAYAKDAYGAADGSDALVVLTDWDEFKDLDLARIKKLLASPIIIDGRNIYEPAEMARLGFNYRGMGR